MCENARSLFRDVKNARSYAQAGVWQRFNIGPCFSVSSLQSQSTSQFNLGELLVAMPEVVYVSYGIISPEGKYNMVA